VRSLFAAVVYLSGYTLFAADLALEDDHLERLRQLQTLGTLSSYIHGQRPISRLYTARLLEEAFHGRIEIPAELVAYHDALLRSMVEQYRAEFENFNADGSKAETRQRIFLRTLDVRIDASYRQAPLTNHPGFVEALIDPMSEHGHGVHPILGTAFGFETTIWFNVLELFEIILEPRLAWRVPREENLDFTVALRRAHLRFNLWGHVLIIGRENLAWGQLESGGLLLDTSDEALGNPFGWPLIILGNDVPIQGFGLGLVRYTAFLATLPGERWRYPQSRILGVKCSWKPGRALELGLGRIQLIGGQGSPEYSFRQGLGDLVGDIATNDEGYALSPAIAGLDGRVDFLRMLTFYGELASPIPADGKEAFPFSRPESLSYGLGGNLANLLVRGTVEVGAEIVRTSPGLYGHQLHLSGFTADSRILGSSLGPAAMGYRLTVRFHLRPEARVVGWLFHERHAGDPFVVQTGEGFLGRSGFLERTGEIVMRGGCSRWTLEWQPGLLLEIDLGYGLWSMDKDRLLNRHLVAVGSVLTYRPNSGG